MGKAFEKLKKKLTGNPVMYIPNYEQDFIIQSDASDRGIWVVMAQQM